MCPNCIRLKSLCIRMHSISFDIPSKFLFFPFSMQIENFYLIFSIRPAVYFKFKSRENFDLSNYWNLFRTKTECSTNKLKCRFIGYEQIRFFSNSLRLSFSIFKLMCRLTIVAYFLSETNRWTCLFLVVHLWIFAAQNWIRI